MESLYRFFFRYHVFLIFLFLEGISFVFIYKSSNYQQSKLMAKVDGLKGYVYSFTSKCTQYFSLQSENEKLAKENNDLRNKLSSYQYLLENKLDVDSLNYKSPIKQPYNYILSEVIKNTTNTQNNSFIINVGKNQGVMPEMGVISNDGVAGIVRNVSNNFATVMSVLNTECKISAKLKRTEYFGPLMWDGTNIREATLIEIPQHASIQVGDTVITSGYSAIFPEGIMIGTVKSYEIKKGSFHEIKILLSTNFSNLRYVEVINSIHRNEIKEHEN